GAACRLRLAIHARNHLGLAGEYGAHGADHAEHGRGTAGHHRDVVSERKTHEAEGAAIDASVDLSIDAFTMEARVGQRKVHGLSPEFTAFDAETDAMTGDTEPYDCASIAHAASSRAALKVRLGATIDGAIHHGE